MQSMETGLHHLLSICMFYDQVIIIFHIHPTEYKHTFILPQNYEEVFVISILSITKTIYLCIGTSDFPKDHKWYPHTDNQHKELQPRASVWLVSSINLHVGHLEIACSIDLLIGVIQMWHKWLLAKSGVLTSSPRPRLFKWSLTCVKTCQ